MRQRNIKAELMKYPCYIYENGRLRRINAPINWHGYHLHHFITTQWQQNNPDKFKEVEHLQKLIFLPPQMHMELHAKHSKFKEKYGMETSELLYADRVKQRSSCTVRTANGREEMISAKAARAKSEASNVRNIREEVEKLIMKAINKGDTSAFKSGDMPEVIQEELKAAGYIVDIQPTGTRVLW